METRVVYMGDSITNGQHCDPTLRWTALVDRVLADGPSKVATFNRSQNGGTTRMGLERYPADVQDLEPDVLTIQFGMNDCNCWVSDRGLPRVSEAAFRANLIEMVERGRVFGAHEVIISTNPCTLRLGQMVSGETYESANARYSGLAREAAAATGATLCDIRAGFEVLGQEELADMLLPDHLHLSVRGNALYAELITPYILNAVTSVTVGVATT